MVHEVRRAQSAEADELSRTLARAFHDDPNFSWVIPDGARRRRVLDPSFNFLLRRVWLGHDATYTDKEIGGVCVWEPPGAWKLGWRQQLSLLPGMGRIWGRSSLRGLRAITMMESGHPSEEHYYLAMVGVQPESQGRGMGSALMFPVLQRCDSERIPAYLEASSARSRALYERHGFEVTEEFSFGREAPPIWRMWREPQ